MAPRSLRPSPSMLVALLALLVALGGTGYAAVTLPKNSVGSKQIQKNAVVSKKVKDGSLLAGDFKAGQLPSGPAGSAVAYGRVAPNGAVSAAKNLIFVTRGTSPIKVYCFNNTSGGARNVQVTVDGGGGIDPLPVQLSVTTDRASLDSFGCGPTSDFLVGADKIDGTRGVDTAFFVAVIA